MSAADAFIDAIWARSLQADVLETYDRLEQLVNDGRGLGVPAETLAELVRARDAMFAVRTELDAMLGRVG